jgi:hypothetical protein
MRLTYVYCVNDVHVLFVCVGGGVGHSDLR